MVLSQPLLSKTVMLPLRKSLFGKSQKVPGPTFTQPGFGVGLSTTVGVSVGAGVSVSSGVSVGAVVLVGVLDALTVVCVSVGNVAADCNS